MTGIWRNLNLAILLAFTCVVNAQALQLHTQVVSIPKEVIDKPLPKGAFADEILYMLQLNSKYILNKWYTQKKDFSKQNSKYLDFKGRMEKDIRPTSHNIFILGFMLRKNIYNPKIALLSKNQANDIFMRLLSSVVYKHKANNPVKNTAWGAHWQSALWAGQIAHGAWFMWESLPTDVQEMVARMVEYEANRFLTIDAPYYRNKDGVVQKKGDSKAEENAWNATVISIALDMMPNHKNSKLWHAKNIEYQLSAYSTPEDMNSYEIIDGVIMCDILKGNNINSDGTLVNHDILHPDYMTAIMHNIYSGWFDKIAMKKPLQSSTHNGDLIYKALTQNLYNGKTIYTSSDNGNASHILYFPEGNDWGGERQANYWLMDIIADIYDWGVTDISPAQYAKVRQKEMLRMMARNTTGEYYQSQKEDSFFSREEWIGQHLLFGYMGLWLYENNLSN